MPCLTLVHQNVVIWCGLRGTPSDGELGDLMVQGKDATKSYAEEFADEAFGSPMVNSMELEQQESSVSYTGGVSRYGAFSSGWRPEAGSPRGESQPISRLHTYIAPTVYCCTPDSYQHGGSRDLKDQSSSFVSSSKICAASTPPGESGTSSHRDKMNSRSFSSW